MQASDRGQLIYNAATGAKVIAENTPLSRHSYRPDIDGLRAVAVLLVIASHLGTRLIGGFIGVDIFFVISGYLISSHILSELSKNTFSLVTFYERRVRRIFPALLVMLVVTTTVSYFILIPGELAEYAKSLFATILSFSNILFWTQNGYFDAPSNMKFLLHTWSLGVEEQFYLVFPLLLIWVHKILPKYIRPIILVAAGTSFLASILMIVHHENAAFFFSPLRMWELLAGTVVSQNYLPQMRNALYRNIASASGALLILLASLRADLLVPFPGPGSIPPVLGAMLIIASGEHGTTRIGQLLSWKPVVFIGAISYSLYLWHWPVIVLNRIQPFLHAGGVETTFDKFVLLAISLVLGFISWRFVEQPFRTGRLRALDKSSLFSISGLLSSVLIIVALSMWHGLPNRFSPEAQRIAGFQTYDRSSMFREGTCFLGTDQGFAMYQKTACLGHTQKDRVILVAGDSHAAHLYFGLSSIFPEDKILQMTVLFPCEPLIRKYNGKASQSCQDAFNYLYEEYLPQHPVGLLVLSARWQSSTEALKETIAYVKSLGISMVLIGPSVEFTSPEPRTIALAMRKGKDAAQAARDTLAPEPRNLDAVMRQAAAEWQVPYISVWDDLCGQTLCPVFAAPDVPLTFDNSHFTKEASSLFAQTARDKHQIQP